MKRPLYSRLAEFIMQESKGDAPDALSAIAIVAAELIQLSDDPEKTKAIIFASIEIGMTLFPNSLLGVDKELN